MTGKRFSVTFSQQTEDQTLLQAVESELAKNKRASFGALCKQALSQLLLNPNPPTAAPPPEATASTVPLFIALQQQIVDLQLKLATLEQSQHEQLKQQFAQLESQIAILQRQVERIDIKVNVALDNPPLVSPQPELAGDGQRSLTSTPESSPEPVVDPLLSRLSSLLESF